MNWALRNAPTATDEAHATPLAGFMREGREAHKRGGLLAVKGTKLPQLSNERARDYRPDNGQRREQVLFLAPGRRAAHGIVNMRVDGGKFMLERLHEPADALLDAGIGPFLPLPLGSDHVDDLAPAGDKMYPFGVGLTVGLRIGKIKAGGTLPREIFGLLEGGVAIKLSLPSEGLQSTNFIQGSPIDGRLWLNQPIACHKIVER